MKTDFTRGEQLGWVALALLLAAGEIGVIHQDRAASDAERRRETQRQQDQFDKTLQGFSDLAELNRTTLHSVGSVLGETKSVAELARQNLNDVTGGDSFVYLIAYSPHPDAACYKVGDAPLYDVIAKMIASYSLAGNRESATLGLKIGDFAAGDQPPIGDRGLMIKPLKLVINTHSDDIEPTFDYGKKNGYMGIDPSGAVIQYELSARNGSWAETECLVRLPESPDGYSWAIKVSRLVKGKATIIFRKNRPIYPIPDPSLSCGKVWNRN